MSDRLAYAAYDAAGIAAAALALPLLPWFLYRGWGDGLTQRLGSLALPAGGLAAPPIWLHAASVGETFAVLPLFRALRERHPEVPWVVSTTTLSGRAVAEREMDGALATLLPIDALGCIDRVFARLQPRALIVAESEVWPGMLRAAARNGASISYVSARLSKRALRRYSWVQPLFGSALRRVDVFCAQSEEDAANLRALGVGAAAIRVTGNLKAGRQIAAGEPPLAGVDERPLFVAASTQEGEEVFVLDACAALWRDGGDALLVLGPRRPERFDAVAHLLSERHLPFQRRSHGESAVAASTRVLLIDTLGELASFYRHARGVFVGGTIAPLGGHNVLEPATAGAAVAFGPHLDNVRAAAAALSEAGAAVEVEATEHLARHWRSLLDDGAAAEQMGERALAVARRRSSALAATVAAVEPHLRGGR